MGTIDITKSVCRRCERIRVRMPVALVVGSQPPESPSKATTIDFSPLGLCVRSEITLAPGERVGLILSDTPSQPLFCRVVWTGEPGPSGSRDAGLEFSQPLTE
ncbi:MAG: PilZ domain-containing protein [Candidatus Acidiferrales bacterium]